MLHFTCMLTETIFFSFDAPSCHKEKLVYLYFWNKKLESSTPIILDGDFNCAVTLTFDRKCDSEKKKHIKKYDKYWVQTSIKIALDIQYFK